MNGLKLSEITKKFGPVVVSDSVSVDLPGGLFTCLLGPSGCGKTMLLRMIAGLQQPDSGSIQLDGRDITQLPAYERQFAMMFQSLALFPHLSVAENIAYSMRLRKVPKARRTARVAELLSLVRLPDIADRRISQLSGGQRQRVAIARALAQDPGIFLLDEPLSALDANLREEMQDEIRQLQKRLGITTVLVTHDRREAINMADRIVVLDKGRVQQVGDPLELYRNPRNRFVASFFGSYNLLDVDMVSQEACCFQDTRLRVSPSVSKVSQGGRATLSILPEDIHIDRPGRQTDNSLLARVRHAKDMGTSVELSLECGGCSVSAKVPSRDWSGVSKDEFVLVTFPSSACRILTE